MPRLRCRRSSRASAGLRDHLDRVYRALLEARAAAGAAAVVELVAMTHTQLDHSVLGTGPQAAVALEAVAARQAPTRFVNGLARREAPYHFGEACDSLLGRELGLLPSGVVAEVPEMELAEARRLMLRWARPLGLA